MRINKILLFATVLLFTISCKNKQDEIKDQIDNLYKFRTYVTDVSQGIISVHSDIRVVLREPVEDWNANQELNSNLFTVVPRVKGKVVALNNQTIAFILENPLEQDTEYKCTVNLGDILNDVPKEFRTFTFKVKTFKQQFNVLTNNLQSYSKDWQYIDGILRTADKLSPETAQKLIKATQAGKEIAIKFDETTAETTQFSFKIDSIQRFVEDSEIAISWDGSPYNIDTKGEAKLNIPGKSNFTILDVTVNDGTSLFLAINFSDPIKKNQNFNGLVALKGAEKLTFSADGNVLKVYPDIAIKGEALLEIFQGIQSNEGYKLKQPFSETIAFEQLKPQVRLLSNGTILPASNNLKINFEAVNLKAVDVSVVKIYENNILQFLQFNDLDGNQYLRNVARPVARKTIQLQSNLSEISGKFRAYAIDLKELITPEPGAIYRVEFNFKPSYGNYRCNTTNFGDETSSGENFDTGEESSYWDNAGSYYNEYSYGYDYDWYERDNPCHTSYYRNKKVAINILASDLGLTIKKGPHENYWASVNDIVSTQPLAGAKVTFYNFQQQEVGNAVTDNNGMAAFRAEHPAYFAIAEKDTQKTYIKLNDGNALSVSKFDVSGVQLQKGLKGYLYGERGVWRPGDTLFLSFMLNDKANDLPENHPVKFELSDPYGKVTQREVKTNGVDNFYPFTVNTDENAPTGNWKAKVSVGGATFSKKIKIETIKPNRLKIKTGFDSEILSGFNPINGTMEVYWLHGAVAKNLKADISARFSSQTTVFSTHPGYVFDDPSRNYQRKSRLFLMIRSMAKEKHLSA